jgi:hypothetical protein
MNDANTWDAPRVIARSAPPSSTRTGRQIVQLVKGLISEAIVFVFVFVRHQPCPASVWSGHPADRIAVGDINLSGRMLAILSLTILSMSALPTVPPLRDVQPSSTASGFSPPRTFFRKNRRRW